MTLQLAVAGSDEWKTAWQQISGRLHGATITDGDDYDGLIADSADTVANGVSNGKPVMVPLDSAGLCDLQQQCQSSGSLLDLYQPLRTTPSIQCVKQELVSGNLGELGLVRLHSWFDAEHSSLANDIDVALWLVEKSPTHVYATGSNGVLQVHLGFDNNEMAVIAHARVESGNYYSLSVVAGDGSAYADDHHNMNLLYDSSGTSALTTSQGDLFQAAAASAFAEAIRNNSPTIPSSDAERVQAVLQAVDQSRESRQAVQL